MGVEGESQTSIGIGLDGLGRLPGNHSAEHLRDRITSLAEVDAIEEELARRRLHYDRVHVKDRLQNFGQNGQVCRHVLLHELEDSLGKFI